MKIYSIAIDGPSASGKGTIAQRLADHFNIPYLNSGALYRALAWHIKQKNISLSAINHEDSTQSQIDLLTSLIKSEDLENKDIMNEDIGSVASIIAKNSKVRKSLFSWQQDFITDSESSNNGCVIDGRDITTIIYPQANYKFYISADVEIRANRRFKQLQKANKNIKYQTILEQLKQRDYNDINRSNSPLKIAKDAVIIDNGNLNIDQTFDKILSFIS